jgi:hypothetical protein
MDLAWIVGLALTAGACGRGAATGGAFETDGGISGAGGEIQADATPSTARDPLTEDLWERAGEGLGVVGSGLGVGAGPAVGAGIGVGAAPEGGGDDADLARLFDREGETGLIERAALPAYRMTALAALAYADDFTPLPFLAGVASTGTDAEAARALASVESLAALSRRAREPEDALELREGCDRLVALARQGDAPRGRRARAVSILRMLADAGFIKEDAIPVDLDPK